MDDTKQLSRLAPVLKPWAPLAHLRPVCLRAMQGYLQDYDRLCRALRLYRDYLPDDLEHFKDAVAGLDWLDALMHFIELVEDAGWLPIDQAALEWAWQVVYEDPLENVAQLAQYLERIPLRLYGLTPEDPDYPPLALLRAILAEKPAPVKPNLLIEAELYDSLGEWGAADRQRLWARLHDIEARPDYYPEPARWLPVWGRWACAVTGNLILDTAFNREGERRFTWADLTQVRWAWQQAKPIIECFEKRFMAWYDADKSHLAILVQFLMRGDNHDELNW